MNVVQISDSLFRELNSPPSLSLTAISYWLRYVGLGKLNIAIDTSIDLDSNLDFEPELNEKQAAILMELYLVNYFDKLIFNSIGANSYSTTEDTWTSIAEGDSRISRINKIDITRQYTILKQEHQKVLDMLITRYRANLAYPLEEKYQVFENFD